MAKRVDAVFFLMKVPESQGKIPPGFDRYYHCRTKQDTIIPSTNVGYLPVIDASPTDLNTVHTILSHSTSVTDSLKQKEIVIIMDQAIYAKAQEICWQTNSYMERLVIRMGEFHTAIAYLSCIGKIFTDAGFQDITIESDVVVAGSIDGVLTGHHYNRSIRAHKLLMEALQRLRWRAYLDTLTQEDHAAALKIATDLQQKFPNEDFNAMLTSDAFLQLLKGYEEFVKKKKKLHQPDTHILEHLHGDGGKSASIHQGNQRGELGYSFVNSAMYAALVFLACDKVNYARYLIAYRVEMTTLEDTHPTVHQQLLSGVFGHKEIKGMVLLALHVIRLLNKQIIVIQRQKEVSVGSL